MPAAGSRVSFASPKSRIFTRSSVGDQQILGLEIAVRDSLLVRRREPSRDLNGIRDRFAHGHGPGRSRSRNRLPFEQFGHDERRIALRADVVHRQDVGMVQRCGRVCFLLESAEAIGIGRERGGQHLDRDVAPKSRIARAIDLAHAARADLGGNLIHPEAGARCEGHA